jgi:hypothetical protein
VTWSGASTVSLTSGGRITSDEIDVTIPAGAKFWERTVILTSATVPVIVLPETPANIGSDDGNVSGDSGNSGTISPGATNANVIGCQAILGTVNATNARSFVIIGDSLCFGALDDTGIGVMGSSGFVARALDDLGIPYFKWAFGGQQATNAATLSPTLNADVGTMDFSDVICQYGLNDLRLGRTQALLLADYQTLYGLANFAGANKWQTTLTPRSTSTDSWATTANQSPQTDGNMAALNSVNAAIRAGLANVHGVIEAADAAMSARDSDIHKAPPIGTEDGTHFNSVRAALVASLCEGVLL